MSSIRSIADRAAAAVGRATEQADGMTQAELVSCVRAADKEEEEIERDWAYITALQAEEAEEEEDFQSAIRASLTEAGKGSAAPLAEDANAVAAATRSAALPAAGAAGSKEDATLPAIGAAASTEFAESKMNEKTWSFSFLMKIENQPCSEGGPDFIRDINRVLGELPAVPYLSDIFIYTYWFNPEPSELIGGNLLKVSGIIMAEVEMNLFTLKSWMKSESLNSGVEWSSLRSQRDLMARECLHRALYAEKFFAARAAGEFYPFLRVDIIRREQRVPAIHKTVAADGQTAARLCDARHPGELGHQQSLSAPAMEAASDDTTAGFSDVRDPGESGHQQSLAAPAIASASDGTTTRWPAARELHGGRSVLLLM
jgi:hypothetical protein